MKCIFVKSSQYLFIILALLVFSATSKSQNKLRVGADRLDSLLVKLEGKKVSIVVNQTSCLSNGVHLLDTLLSSGINIKNIYVPEHGFRGNADAGEVIKNGRDIKSGKTIVSLYGSNKKPSKESLNGTDIIVFDLQDVGTRFYTYISTMHYVMEACAENTIECIILDRPNPNDYIDGPILEPKFKSFVGMHPIPVVHGLTIGELALMINGEGWLTNRSKCLLTVIPIEGWKHGQPYSLPIKPSPNLPNDQAVSLYPSLCFFEATNVSVGRGTYFPFQVIGYPNSTFGSFTFMPKSLAGYAKNPPQQNKLCYGLDLRKVNPEKKLTLTYLLSFYKKSKLGKSFFRYPDFMDKLAGTSKLREQILAGIDEEQIRESWKKDIDSYKKMREKYLLYP